MKRLSLVLVIGTALAVTGCGGGSDDDGSTSASPDSVIATTEAVNENPAGGEGAVVVGGPNGDTLEVEEFGDVANWWYGSSTVMARLCGELTADRTVRIYRATDAENQGGVFCEDGGGSILNLEAGRDLEQPDQDGTISMENGDIGVITAGGDTFGKSGLGTATVEISSTVDRTIAPVTLDIEASADTGQVRFTFSAPLEG